LKGDLQSEIGHWTASASILPFPAPSNAAAAVHFRYISSPTVSRVTFRPVLSFSLVVFGLFVFSPRARLRDFSGGVFFILVVAA
jgi:hypothetical protein